MKPEPRKPNIVFILADDMGSWAMGCAGNQEVITPNIDKLAAEGIRFENFFCVSPVCSPARASLLTGRIPSSHGIHDWIAKGNIDDPGGNYRGKDRPVEYLNGLRGYTDFLTENGYLCGLSGKWHMGDSANPQKGFSSWYTHGFGGGQYYDYAVCEDGEIKNRKKYVTYDFTDKALEFIESQEQNVQPFYLSVHYTAPHSPWSADNHPDDILEMYKDCPFESAPDLPIHPNQVAHELRGDTPEKRRTNLTGYYAAITAMDHCIGKIIDKLDEFGLRENTIIIFSGDNGMNMGHHGIWGKGNGTFPMNMYDTSVKVPFIVSWPGKIPENRVNSGLYSHYDFLPTLLDYLDIPNPPAKKLPGRSFAPLLYGEEDKGNGQVVIFDEYGPVRMIRTREWKYVHRYPYGPHELYDLVSDPDENSNLLGLEKYEDKVIEMRGKLQSWFEKYLDPARDGARMAVTGAGQIDLADSRNNGNPAFLELDQ
jgi:arylsulfatase A-like enzyme